MVQAPVDSLWFDWRLEADILWNSLLLDIENQKGRSRSGEFLENAKVPFSCSEHNIDPFSDKAIERVTKTEFLVRATEVINNWNPGQKKGRI